MQPSKRRSDEAALVERAQSGDREAFAELVRRSHPQVAALCGSLLGSSRADDASQEVFLKAYEALDRFEGSSSVSTWLHRIAYNHCLDLLRADARRKVDSLEAIEEESPGALDRLLSSPDDAALGLERRDLIRRVLSLLSPEQRLILTLREQQGLTYEELGEALEATVDAVKARLRRARRALEEAVRHLSARGDV